MKKNHTQWRSLEHLLLGLLCCLGINYSLQAQCDFERTIPGKEDYIIPSGITEITVEAIGADGGTIFAGGLAPGGAGGTTTATFSVTPGDVIRFIVGEAGLRSNNSGNGGGATAVINCGSSGANCDAGNGTLLMVAGGGGGSAFSSSGGFGATTVEGNGDGGASGPLGSAGGGGLNGPGLTTNTTVPEIPGPAASQNPSFTSRDGEGFAGGGLGSSAGFNGGGGGGYTGGAAAANTGDPGSGGSNFIISTATNVTNTAGADAGGTDSDGSVCITSQVAGLAVTLTASPISCAGDNVTYTASAAGAINYEFFLDNNNNGQVDGGESLQNSASNTFISNTIPVGDLLSVIATDGTLTGSANVASPAPAPTTPPTVICADGFEVYLDAGGMATISAADLDGGSTDACGETAGLMFSVNDDTFDCSDVGATTQPSSFALDFDGTDDFVESSTSDALKRLPLTLEAWVKPRLRNDENSGSPGSPRYPNNVISNDTPGVGGHGFGANITPSSNVITVELDVTFSDGFFRQIDNAGLVANEWQHIATVYDSLSPTQNRVITYLNGVAIDTYDYTSRPLDANEVFVIGKHNDDPSYSTRRFFNGQIDEVRVWNRALAGSEIAANRFTTSVGNETDLYLYYTFEDGVGNSTLTDIISSDVAQLNNMDINEDWVQPGAPVDVTTTSATMITLTVTDAFGNIDSCMTTIAVLDTFPPTFTCPAPQNVNLTDTCSIVVPDLLSGITDAQDACGGTVILAQIPGAGSIVTDLGHDQTTEVIIIADDGRGNADTCIVVLTAKDVTDPSISCLGAYSDVLNVCDEYTPDAGILGITATDGCSQDITVTFVPAIVTTAGTTSVTATATDSGGNTAICTFDLTLSTNPDKLTINATADVFNTDQFEPITFTDADLLANDSSTPMGLTLEVEEVTLLDPSQGSLTEVDETTYSFTPAGGFTGTANLSYTLKVQNGATFFEDNGHFYEVVGDNLSKFTWTEARDSAENKILAGLSGYLATITSQEENDFIASLLDNKGKSWIGASDNGGVATFGGSPTEGDWRWVTGPEGQANGGTGTPFWLGDEEGSPVGMEYNNWYINQFDGTGISPNNLQGIEHYGYMYGELNPETQGAWDDHPFRNDQRTFIVEYGGVDGCSPSVTANANISINVQPDANTGFITTWKVDAQDPTIDIFTDPSFSYNFTVDWGDGNTDMNVSSTITHTYASPGVYSVKIGGTFPRFMSDNNNTAPGNAWKIESIDQWGDIQWESMFRSFNNATNMKYNASDAPDFTNCDRLSFMFANCLQLDENTDLSNWDVSGIELFNNMFLNAVQFNGNIDNWDLSSATVLEAMFQFARSFNRDISGWNLSNVQNIRSLFSGADSFNQDIGDWDVSNVTDMIGVFSDAIAFNQDISTWERTTPTVSTTANVIDMRGMFSGATAFNQDISNWDVSNVRDMKSMFFNASSFDQDLGNWNLSALSAVVPLRLFLSNSGLSTANYDATLIGWAAQPTFPSNISPVGVAGLTYCAGRDARQQLIDDKGWFFSGDAQDAVACGDLPFVTTWEVTADDLDISIYEESDFTYDFTVDWGDGTQDMNATGTVTHTYAQPGVYTVSITGNFPALSVYSRFDQPNSTQLNSIEQWGSIEWESLEFAFTRASNMVYNATDVPDLSRVTSLFATFAETEKFNASLNDWDVSKVQVMWSCFNQTRRFNGDISRWDVSNVVDMNFMFNESRDFNQSLDSWDVSNVKFMTSMFRGTSTFNQPLDSWNISSVNNISSMFRDASAFNQPLNSWDVSNVQFMISTFRSASVFNQSLNNWNVSNVERMASMFRDASSFNQSLADWNLQSLAPGSGSEFIGGVNMLDNSGVDKANYDATLIGWAANPTTASGVTLGAAGLTFCAGASARTDLINNKGWTFEGDMEDCPSPNANEDDDVEARTEVATTALNIHPNPANMLINIRFQEAALNSQLVIRDQLGRVIWSQQVGGKQDQLQLTLDRNLFPAGMYWVSLDTGETVATEKLIVVK